MTDTEFKIYLNSLTPDQLERRTCEIIRLQSIRYYVPYVTKGYASPEHLRPLCDALDSIQLGEQRFILVSVAPRHGKSDTLARFIPYFYEIPANRTKNIIYCTYSQTLSEDKTTIAHDICQMQGINPDPKMANRNNWRLKEGGSIFTTGVMGTLIGVGGNVIIVDDPIKDSIEANSKIYKERMWDWFCNVLETRLEPNGSIIVCMQRWNEDDLIGRILEYRPRYEYIRIPAIADGLSADGKHEEVDPLNRPVGTALWADRYPIDVLQEIQNNKPLTFIGQYQGLPRRKEDALFKECTYYTELPTEYQIVAGCDLAYTSKTQADFSVVVVGYKVGNKLYIKEVIRWQKDINYSIKRLQEIQNQYDVKFTIEDNGVQKAICDMLKSNNIKINRITPKGDKYSRALPFIESWNSGNVLLPDTQIFDANWLKDYVEEIINFTGINDRHDDQVDASVYCNMSKKSIGFMSWESL